MKRYAHQVDYYGGDMVESPTGNYIRYEDVADLQCQLAEVTRERDTLKAMLTLTEAQRDRLLAEKGNGK